MGRPTKTPYQKLTTKVNRAENQEGITRSRSSLKYRNRIIVSFNKSMVKYGVWRLAPRQKEDLLESNYKVHFPLTHENLPLLASNFLNPPRGARVAVDNFKRLTGQDIDKLTIGAETNEYSAGHLQITKALYLTISRIDKEEAKDKSIRVSDRLIPLIESKYEIETISPSENVRDYRLLLEEIMASGMCTQEDIFNFAQHLEEGSNNKVVINRQINKQVAWLLDIVQTIIDHEDLNVTSARQLGNQHFGFSKMSISGPEHLMEMILSEYGRNTFFGVPVLINTDKYVVNSGRLSRCQFDMVLVDHLYDVTVVELKRPDSTLLEYDRSRKKFYISKDLSIAVSQAERYLSTMQKNNDEHYTIDGVKISEYLGSFIEGSEGVDIVRPQAVIVAGTYQSIAKPYDQLSQSIRSKTTRDEYSENSMRTYKELKYSFKNIQLITFSELLEIARARLLVDQN